jgi:hypothetical protein
MELLTGELRLLKSAIELMSGRLELMLAEIAELQSEQQNTTEDLVGQTQLQSHQASLSAHELHRAQPLDAAAPSVVSVVLAPGYDAPPQISAIAEQLLPVEPKLFADHDAPELYVEVAPVAIVETVPPETCGAETTASSNPETLPGAATEPSAIAPESASGSIAPHVGDDAPKIIFLDERRNTSARRPRNSVRAVAHCAASFAMIALVLAVATSSGLADFFASTVRATSDPVHIALPVTAF